MAANFTQGMYRFQRWGLRTALVFLIPLQPILSFADEEVDVPSAASEPFSMNANSMDEDTWYFTISSGLGRPSYDEGIQSRISSQKALGAESPFGAFVDLPGIYRRIRRSGWAAGFVMNAIFENYARSWRDNQSFAITLLNPSASGLYFPGGRIGLGWFARGDLGYTQLIQTQQTNTADGNSLYERSYDTGLIVQGAIGYGWQASAESRVLAHLNAFHCQAGDRLVNGTSFNVGFLF